MATKQFIISGTSDDPGTASTDYSGLMGNGNIAWTSPETDCSELISTPGKLSNFKVGIKTAPGTGKSWTFTIRQNGIDTALSVSISNSSTISALDTDEVTVAAGDKVSISATPAGTPTACAAVYWTCQFTPDTDGETMLLGYGSLTADYYDSLIGGKGGDVTEFDAQTLFPTAGTLKQFYVELNAAPGTGNSRTFTLYKNSVVTAIAVTISNSATTGNDLVNTLTIAAGDKVTIKQTQTGTPATARAFFGTTFLPNTQGEYIVSATTDDLTSSTAVEYQQLTCGDSTLTATENEQHGLAQALTAKAIYVNLVNAPGNGSSWIFTLREALLDTTLTVTISNTATSGNAATDEAVAADALVNSSIDARAGTVTSATQIAYLLYNAPTGVAGVQAGYYYRMYGKGTAE